MDVSRNDASPLLPPSRFVPMDAAAAAFPQQQGLQPTATGQAEASSQAAFMAVSIGTAAAGTDYYTSYSAVLGPGPAPAQQQQPPPQENGSGSAPCGDVLAQGAAFPCVAQAAAADEMTELEL
jgi:hypothetical protein